MNIALAAVALGHGKLFPAGRRFRRGTAPWTARSRRSSSPASGIGAAKAWRWSRRPEGESHVVLSTTTAGRPIVVVTGMGVVTSLGAGKADNWAKLTAGQSGIRAITRFPTDGPARPGSPARSISCRSSRTRRPALSERLAELAAEEAIAESGIGRRGDFPGPLFLAVPPIEIEWPQRLELAQASGANDTVDLRRPAARRRDRARQSVHHARFMFGSVADNLAEHVRHQGLADLAVDRLRLGRDRDPARRRGDPPRRDRCRALRRHRRLDQSGIADPLLAALGAVDRQRPARSRPPSRSPRTATAS